MHQHQILIIKNIANLSEVHRISGSLKRGGTLVNSLYAGHNGKCSVQQIILDTNARKELFKAATDV